MSTENVYYATGRRKTSTARVFLKAGSGQLTVNGKNMQDYLCCPSSQASVREPLEITNSLGKFDARITVKGGGETGQSGAIKLGIARALILVDEALRGALKKAGMLTRDARKVERKKYGLRGARKASQFSKR